LGEALQAITVPSHLTCDLQGKSGLARHGLFVHCTAPYIWWPGWGREPPKRVILDLKNLGPVSIKLRAGEPIAQIVFRRHGIPPPGCCASLRMKASRHCGRAGTVDNSQGRPPSCATPPGAASAHSARASGSRPGSRQPSASPAALTVKRW